MRRIDTSSLESAGGRAAGRWTRFDWRRRGETIAQRIRSLATDHPDRLAVLDPGCRLTYSALQHAAEAIARTLLRERGNGPEAVVLLLDLGVQEIVAALGVLASGKHFVAVEPGFAPERIVQIAVDAGAGTVLTDAPNRAAAQVLAEAGLALVCIDDARPDGRRFDGPAVDLDGIATLHYTSGSTGRPKGVFRTQRIAIAQAVRYCNAFELGDEDRLATFGSLAWSGATSDVFGTLCLGAAAAAYDVRRHGIEPLAGWLRRERITVVSGMPVVRPLVFGFPDERLPEVRLVQLGGDTVHRRDVVACQRVMPNAIIAVGMGITETGRVVQQFIPPGSIPEHEVVPVGFPVPGVRVRLVDDDGNAVNPGAIGEIVVESEHNSAGYWRMPEQTAAKFRPAEGPPGTTAYFTGDLGLLLPDGMLQHAGRKDFQVKIRGYQVLTNDVEALLLGIDGVREACVVAQTTAAGGEQLVAFLVRDVTARSTTSALQARLAQRLPGHMVPHRFVDLDALPKTASGKPDRRALPVVAASRDALDTPYVAPRTPLEAAVASIWRDVLAIDAVGVEDAFLALGGDSLQATRIVSRVQQALGPELAVTDLLAGQTVAAMAALIAQGPAAGRPAPPPIRRRRQG